MSNPSKNEPKDTPFDIATVDTGVVMQGTNGKEVARLTARRAKAVALRIAGLSYSQIAEQVGYSDKSAARHAVMQSLDGIMVENVERLREVEAMRLDRLQAAVWQRAMSGDDAAIRTALRIIESRARLLGLNAPVVIEMTEGVDRQLGELRALLAQDTNLYVVTDLGEPAGEQHDPGPA